MYREGWWEDGRIGEDRYKRKVKGREMVRGMYTEGWWEEGSIGEGRYKRKLSVIEMVRGR